MISSKLIISFIGDTNLWTSETVIQLPWVLYFTYPGDALKVKCSIAKTKTNCNISWIKESNKCFDISFVF